MQAASQQAQQAELGHIDLQRLVLPALAQQLAQRHKAAVDGGGDELAAAAAGGGRPLQLLWKLVVVSGACHGGAGSAGGPPLSLMQVGSRERHWLAALPPP